MEDNFIKDYNPKTRAIKTIKITPDTSCTGDKWGVIQYLISDYSKLHPFETREFLFNIRERKAELKNEYASNESKTMRLALSLPVGLMFLIERYFPEVFKTKQSVRQFMRRFPGFALPKK